MQTLEIEELKEQTIDFKRLKYPRVSEIIGKQNYDELRSIPIETLANACIRGTKVDNYCTAFLRGLWVSDIEEEYQPYVDEFMRWADENVDHLLYSKVRLYDDVNRFTGEPDFLVVLKKTKQTALLDLKVTSLPSKTWPIQLAAYKHLCQLNGYEGIDRVFNLHLKKNPAKYKKNGDEKVLVSPPTIKAIEIDYVDLKPYWEIFASALKCYDYFHRKEEKTC